MSKEKQKTKSKCSHLTIDKEVWLTQAGTGQERLCIPQFMYNARRVREPRLQEDMREVEDLQPDMFQELQRVQKNGVQEAADIASCLQQLQKLGLKSRFVPVRQVLLRCKRSSETR